MNQCLNWFCKQYQTPPNGQEQHMCGKSIHRGTFNTREKKFLKAAFHKLQIFNMWRKAETDRFAKSPPKDAVKYPCGRCDNLPLQGFFKWILPLGQSPFCPAAASSTGRAQHHFREPFNCCCPRCKLKYHLDSKSAVILWVWKAS